MIFNYVDDLDINVIDKYPNCILDFYADWCGQCKSLFRFLNEFAERHPNFPVIKVDVEAYEDFTESFNVQHLPTLVFIKDGKEIDRKGFLSLVTLEDTYKNIYNNYEKK